jgi:Questin oxidase-like
MSLRQLLDHGTRFDAEYGAGLSNHLPMALLALQRLGASEDRLEAFATRYASRLEPAPPAEPWPAGDAWKGRLGERSAWPAYRSLFAEWLAFEEAEAVLAQALPDLMSGCGGAAFHGLIRTAYAMQAGHPGELADALAYWACRHLPLGAAPAGRQKNPTVLLPALEAALEGRALDQGLIFERMREAATLPAFARVAARLRVHEGTLPALARLAAGLYARSGDFAALHLVTSAHAVRVLLPFVDDPALAVGYYWRAFAAGFGASGVKAGEPVEARDWPSLAAAAVAGDDEHVVKLVDSCREEERAYGGDDWRLAASRAVQART